MSINQKFKRLCLNLKRLNSAVLAYSGGVDSSFLLSVARGQLKRLIAVTADSATIPREELRFAKRFCDKFGACHKIIATKEIRNKDFTSNSRERCYFCKRELFSRLESIARRNRIPNVMDASNIDDKDDFRPGNRAKIEFKVLSPLQEAKLNKKEIRLLSKRLGLPTWNKPQMACLASRIPYGERITKDKLERIEKAEAIIRKIFRLNGNVRVRLYKDLARIEVDKKEIPRIINNQNLVSKLKVLGFKYITVDLEGYRTGSMNEV